MEFDGDEVKRLANFTKHGVDFAIVQSIDWLGAGVFADERADYGEQRLIAYGDVPASGGYVIVSLCAERAIASSAFDVLAERTAKSMTNSEDDNRIYGVPDDESPELTEEMAKKLRPLNEFLAERGLPVPGRPKSDNPKISVSLRLDPEVVAGFKADGPGWQTRMNAVLAESLKLSKKSA